MTLQINNKKMSATGFNFTNMDDLYFYCLEQIQYLESHNKNYTKIGYSIISNLKDIFEGLEVV